MSRDLRNDIVLCIFMILLTGAVPPALGQVPTEGLVAYYPFNGNANDESGNGNDGAVNGATLTTDRFGNQNSAYSFDGDKDYIDLGTSSLFNLGNYNEFTISCWVDPSDTDAKGIVMSKYVSTSDNRMWDVKLPSGTDEIYFDAYNGGDRKNPDSVRCSVTGDWQHIVIVFSNSQYKLYSDGQLITTLTKQVNMLSSSSTAKTLIGAYYFATENFDWSFNGSIDDIALYSRALTEAEIINLYGSSNQSQETDFTSFSLPQQTSPATINTTDHTISITVSSGTDLTSLIPTFSLSTGATAKVGGITQESGLTANDYTNPVTYTVTAEDGTTTQEWVVNVFQEVSTEGLVAYYPFNGNAIDESGNGNNGTVNGATLTADRFGNANSAYSFDGTNDKIDIGTDSAFALGNYNDFTFSVWIKPNGDNSEGEFVFSKYDPVGDYRFFNFQRNVSGEVEFRIYQNGKTNTIDGLSWVYAKNSWNHLVWTYSSGLVKIYIDGELKDSKTLAFNITTKSSSVPATIGAANQVSPTSDANFNGLIDDLALYSRALSDSEILSLYNGYQKTNQAPSISAQTFSIPENSIQGTSVGTVQASDPNEDELTYSITSGNTDNAFAINSSSGQLTVFNQSALDYETHNSFQLSVSVTDGAASASTIITINLTDVNEQEPQIVEETFILEESVANGTIATIQAADPDSESVTFSGSFNGPFTIDSANGYLILTDRTQLDFVTIDKYALTVQVSDGELSSSGTITVDLNNPTVFQKVTIPDEVSSTGLVEVEVSAADLDGIQTGWLYKKKISDASYANPSTTTINSNGSMSDILNSSLTSTDFDNQGSEYYFRISDNLGKFSSSSTYYTYLVSSNNGLGLTMKGAPGSSLKNYSIISFPFAAPSVEGLLEELGPYNKKNWRLFRFNSDEQSYSEYNAFNSVQPGEGYWFIQKDDISLRVGGRAVSLTQGSFQVELHQGFNIVGNPFQGTLDWTKTIQHNIDEGIINSEDIDPAYRSELYKWNTAYITSNQLSAFEGGFVKANKTIQGFEFPVSALTDAGARYASELPQPHPVNIDSDDWLVNFFIKSPSYDYYLGGFGTNAEANDYQDDFDRFPLPKFSKYLDIAFAEGETRSIKESATFKSWSFTVPNNLSEQYLSLSWDVPVSNINTIVLVNGVSRKIHDLSEITEIKLENQPEATHYLFYGSKTEIYQNLEIPFDVFYEAHPNPIGESISLKVFANNTKEVKIEIVSMDGSVVLEKSLIMEKGLNQQELELKNHSLTNGIYLLKFNKEFVTKLIKQ